MQSNVFADIVAGGTGGLASIMVGHPLDTVKVRLQTTGISSNGIPKYSGMVDCIVKIISNEGPYALFKGITSPLLGITPCFAVQYLSYTSLQPFARKILDNQVDTETPVTIAEHLVASTLAAFPTLVPNAPVHRVKCLLQVQGPNSGMSSPKFTGALDCAAKLVKEGGLSSLNKGWEVLLLRDMIGIPAYFGTYQFCLRLFLPEVAMQPKGGKCRTLYEKLAFSSLAGGIAGVTWAAVTHPIDTVKSKINIAESAEYRGWRGILEATWALAGPVAATGKGDAGGGGGGGRGRQLRRWRWGALLRGLSPALARAFPSSAAFFLGLELTKGALGSPGLVLDDSDGGNGGNDTPPRQNTVTNLGRRTSYIVASSPSRRSDVSPQAITARKADGQHNKEGYFYP